ncbi:hypothetical protein BLOT_012896 [Blomia tropicalis]|nr:hypothetical protein BLOT_012896 [Blomia tropicalis]
MDRTTSISRKQYNNQILETGEIAYDPFVRFAPFTCYGAPRIVTIVVVAATPPRDHRLQLDDAAGQKLPHREPEIS